jgi:hypothetical protein
VGELITTLDYQLKLFAQSSVCAGAPIECDIGIEVDVALRDAGRYRPRMLREHFKDYFDGFTIFVVGDQRYDSHRGPKRLIHAPDLVHRGLMQVVHNTLDGGSGNSVKCVRVIDQKCIHEVLSRCHHGGAST